MRKNIAITFLIALAINAVFVACSSKEKDAPLPPPPTAVKQVQDLIVKKELHVKKTGQYGMAILDNQPEIEWIDTTVQKSDMAKRVIRDIGEWKLKLINDTACEITSADEKYSGTWSVDDKADEKEEAGIRLRISYMDPEFNTGLLAGSPVTFTYIVKGINEQSILLELPRELNRRKLVSLLRVQ